MKELKKIIAAYFAILTNWTFLFYIAVSIESTKFNPLKWRQMDSGGAVYLWFIGATVLTIVLIYAIIDVYNELK